MAALSLQEIIVCAKYYHPAESKYSQDSVLLMALKNIPLAMASLSMHIPMSMVLVGFTVGPCDLHLKEWDLVSSPMHI